VTESTFTLDEARRVLARQACELDLQGGFLTGYDPFGRQRPKRMETIPLGHDLAKEFHDDAYANGLKGYRCLRCDAFFAEVVTGEQHQLPAGEPAS
jgi:hypothetical protein